MWRNHKQLRGKKKNLSKGKRPMAQKYHHNTEVFYQTQMFLLYVQSCIVSVEVYVLKARK